MQSATNKACWWSSTIGRKQLIGLTGLGLSLFVLVHMLENILILIGPKVYNNYANFLTSNPLIYVAEAGLLAIFLGHVILALRITLQNFAARDTRYALRASGPKRTSAAQRSLWIQGLLILVFLVLHLISFKFGPEYSVDYGQGPIRDLHKLVIEDFHDPLFVGWYIFALLVLGVHLSHGIGSVFQTLGLHHPRYQGLIRAFSVTYAVLVTLGFIVQPLYVYFLS
jgi:succinate dehydrogenase / fumarate reductase cytochrome b subunit